MAAATPYLHLTEGDFPHFRGLWKRITLGLTAAALAALMLLGGGVYAYTARVFDEKRPAAQEKPVTANVPGGEKAALPVGAVSVDEQLRRIRRVGGLLFVVSAGLMVASLGVATHHLVGRLEAKRRHIEFMGHYLRQANQMTLSLQLQPGFLQDIAEALANIASAGAWIGEQVRGGEVPDEIEDSIGTNLKQIRSEVIRSRQTLHQIIDFSRPAVPLIAPVDINALLDRLIELFHRELYYSDITIHRDFEEPGTTIRSDPVQLEQVFQNLILNAREAIDTGEDLHRSGHIHLKTTVAEDWVHVAVADDGPGIDARRRGDLFAPRVTSRPAHLGIGLSICRDILAKLGGRITVGDRPGGGAVFTVSLPLGRDLADPSAAKRDAAHGAAQT